MTFYTGTITGGGGSGLLAKIEECLALHSTNREYVEEVTYTYVKNSYHHWIAN